MNAAGERRSLRTVASKYSRYQHAQSSSSEAAETVREVRKSSEKAKPTDDISVGKSKVGTREEPKMVLERRTLQRLPEKFPPEGNGGLPDESKVPSLVLQHINPAALEKKAIAANSTHRAQQLLHRAKNRLLVKKEKVVRKARKKPSPPSASSSSPTAMLTSPLGEDGRAVVSDSTSIPPLVEEDDGEVGEASEEEEKEGGEEGEGEERPRKVKIKLPDSKVPSELLNLLQNEMQDRCVCRSCVFFSACQ